MKLLFFFLADLNISLKPKIRPLKNLWSCWQLLSWRRIVITFFKLIVEIRCFWQLIKLYNMKKNTISIFCTLNKYSWTIFFFHFCSNYRTGEILIFFNCICFLFKFLLLFTYFTFEILSTSLFRPLCSPTFIRWLSTLKPACW